MGGFARLLGAWGDETVSGGRGAVKRGQRRGGKVCADRCQNAEEEGGGQSSSGQEERVGRTQTDSQVSKPRHSRLLCLSMCLEGGGGKP